MHRRRKNRLSIEKVVDSVRTADRFVKLIKRHKFREEGIFYILFLEE